MLLVGLIIVLSIVGLLYFALVHQPLVVPVARPTPTGAGPPSASNVVVPLVTENETPVGVLPEPQRTVTMRDLVMGGIQREFEPFPGGPISPFIARDAAPPEVIHAQPVSPPVEEQAEPLGELLNPSLLSSATDTRYKLESTHPGLGDRGRELTLTNPTRRTIRLCRDGGFLRRYGGGEWRRVPHIFLGGYPLSYTKEGFIHYRDQYKKSFVVIHKGEDHMVKLVGLLREEQV